MMGSLHMRDCIKGSDIRKIENHCYYTVIPPCSVAISSHAAFKVELNLSHLLQDPLAVVPIAIFFTFNSKQILTECLCVM